MFELRNDIPAPERKNAGRPAETMPFNDMQVGNSFFVPCGASAEVNPATNLAPTEQQVLARVRTKLLRWKKANPDTMTRFRITPYRDEVVGTTSVGVWRTE